MNIYYICYYKYLIEIISFDLHKMLVCLLLQFRSGMLLKDPHVKEKVGSQPGL